MKYNHECNAIDLCIRKRNELDDFNNEEIPTSFPNKIAKVIEDSLNENHQLLHKRITLTLLTTVVKKINVHQQLQ